MEINECVVVVAQIVAPGLAVLLIVTNMHLVTRIITSASASPSLSNKLFKIILSKNEIFKNNIFITDNDDDSHCRCTGVACYVIPPC